MPKRTIETGKTQLARKLFNKSQNAAISNQKNLQLPIAALALPTLPESTETN